MEEAVGVERARTTGEISNCRHSSNSSSNPPAGGTCLQPLSDDLTEVPLKLLAALLLSACALVHLPFPCLTFFP